MVKKLEEKGFTYKTSDGVYFDTSKQADYGKLAGLDKAGLQEGARVEINKEKKNPTDFALWKFSPKNEKRQMEWSSPWGVGFPGWHIECSAMSIKYLGEPFDIHAGAIDLIPVHHTNEVAQNEAVYGEKTVNYWLHSGFLLVDGHRMGKSLGNAYTIDNIINKGFNPLSYRYLTFTAHYKQELNFTWASLEQAKFKDAINDDLNMPKAIAVVWEMLNDNTLQKSTKLSTIYRFDEVLGLDIMKMGEKYALLTSKIPETVQAIKKERDEARQNKNWQKSDELRDKILSLGYEVDDTPEGTLLSPKLLL
jgi:cysteinyl-tRNA synthetase